MLIKECDVSSSVIDESSLRLSYKKQRKEVANARHMVARSGLWNALTARSRPSFLPRS